MFVVLLGLASAALAQARPSSMSSQQIIERACRGPEVTTGTEWAQVDRIDKRLKAAIKSDGSHRIHVALTRARTINAWEVPVDSTRYLVCVPVAMVHFMGEAEGELAFVVAHEIGHALDDLCRTKQGRLAVARSQGSLGAALGELLGGDRTAYKYSTLAQQKGCEERADEIGFLIFTAAGYNPFDAAGSFGRLEMYSGDTGTGLVGYLQALGSDHPMTPERIKHMRTLLIEQIKESKDGSRQ
jgi:predicted Zn-dependent protease